MSSGETNRGQGGRPGGGGSAGSAGSAGGGGVAGGSGGAIRRPGLSGDVVSGPGRGRKRGGADDDPLDEGPSQADLDKLNSATRTCPECGKEVFGDSEVCYHCGHAFMERARPGVPPWAVVAAALVVASLLAGFVLRLW